MAEPLWIPEADVVELIDMADAIAALQRGVAAEAAGKAMNMVKTHALWGKNTLHAIGAVFAEQGLVGTKTWAHTEGGACPLLILFDSHDGSLRAIIEAFALGQLRTGGISGLATQWMAAPDADDFALIGTGKQALTQLAAIAAVRHLRRVRVFSPTPENRRRFAERARAELGLRIEEAPSVEAAVRDASIVTLLTRATAPFITSAMLARGTHINAVGAITPERAEFDPAILDRCGVIAGDSIDQVRRLSREFREYFGTVDKAWGRVLSLASLIAVGKRRPADADLTMFKAMGIGISDLSLGTEILKRAAAKSKGRPLPQPQKAKLRFARATEGVES